MLRAKAHGLVVTGKNLFYEGSLTLGIDIIKAAQLYPLEYVEVYNVTNGIRFSTYIIPGPEGVVELNGAAARLGEIGDILIVAAYDCVIDPTKHIATVAIFKNNKLQEVRRVATT